MFCPACATAVESGQANCPNCGELLPTFGPAQTAQLPAIQAMPAAVRQAGVLLWVSVGISVVTFTISLIFIWGRVSPGAFAAPILLFMALWILGITFAMRRSNPARILIFLLVAYSAFNILIRFRSYVAHANPGALVSVLELALRMYAVYLLLRPESSAWFAGKQRDILT